MVALHDLCWNFLFSHQMICKQHIILNHKFFRYESNLKIQTCYIYEVPNVTLRARSHLTTVTQIFDVISMSSEMGCVITNVTVHTWRQKKTHRCRQVRKDP